MAAIVGENIAGRRSGSALCGHGVDATAIAGNAAHDVVNGVVVEVDAGNTGAVSLGCSTRLTGLDAVVVGIAEARKRGLDGTSNTNNDPRDPAQVAADAQA